MNTMFSGEQLVLTHGKTDHEMPQTGLKEFQPSNSWLEQKQIQSALEQRKTLLEEERVEKWNLLMKAKWVPEKHKAEVTQKGKPWEVFGHHSDSGDWLFPEEVLFLMETNCLECLYGEVPLSIQRGHTVLLDPEHGCSIKEYRVYSHLCRAGYRVVRHLSNLTVTSYERQIRLDQHLDQKKTYDESTSSEPEILRPDLPPKKILDLMENTEIVIDPSSLPLSAAEEKPLVKVLEKSMEVVQEPIEVITLEDSSSEESADEESSSDDSAVEIIGEFMPFTKTTSDSIPKNEKEEDDDDIEIIEVPVSKKEIVVATIESSDGENDIDISDSGSERSYDGNWKRNKPQNKKTHFVRPNTMSKLNFLAVDEFCADSIVGLKKARDNALTNGNLNETDVSNGDVNTSNSVENSTIEPSSSVRARPKFNVYRKRDEILDLMPSMAHQNNKLMTLNTPDLRLVPNTIEPKQDSYIYNTYALRAKTFSNFRPYRGRRHFHGSRFNSYNPYYNTHAPLDQFNGAPLLQSPSLTQVFGSDIQSMARGMLQLASTLLMNASPINQGTGVLPLMSIPQNNDRLLPFNPHSNFRAHDTSGFSQPQTFFDEPPRNFSSWNHNRFSDSSFGGSPAPMNEITQVPFRNRSFGRDHSNDSRNSRGGGDSDFNSRERAYTPPVHTRPRGRPNRPVRSRRPFNRNPSNRSGAFTPAPRDFRPNNPIFPSVDPAYVKNDVPLPANLSFVEDGSGNFIPITSTNQNPVEIIDVADTEAKFVPRSIGGISQNFTRKQKRKIKQRMRVAKKRRLDQQPVKNEAPEIIFLDSPSSSNSDAIPVKQESGTSNVDIKTESLPTQNVPVKREGNENTSEVVIKNESTNDVLVKSEESTISGQEPRVKTEENSDVSVKLEHVSGGNLRVDIKIDSSSETSSVSSLPITSQIKSEHGLTIKSETNVSSETEPLNDIKIEPVAHIDEVKTEKPAEDVQVPNSSIPNVSEVQNSTPLPNPEDKSAADGVVEKPSESVSSKESSLETGTSEKVPESDVSRTTERSETVSDEINSEMEVDVPSESLDVSSSSSVQISDQQKVSEASVMEVETQSGDISCETLRTTQTKTSDSEQNKNSSNRGSNWAEVKKNNALLGSFQETQDECSDEDEEDEIRPLIRPKHCKTIGTVLSALQIFSPFSPNLPEDVQKLKISFDMYLATDFRKSQRGLPQFRIAVFGGTEPIPSPAQLQELQTRFEDQVPVLRAVVMPDSVVFYSCSNISLPVENSLHRE